MRSIIKNPIHRIEYNKSLGTPLSYTNKEKYWYYNPLSNCIIVEGVGGDIYELSYYKELQVYKSCFIIRNDRGGLIYA